MITSLKISFGTPSIPDAILVAFSLPLALFSSSNVKSFPPWTVQGLWSSRGNYSTGGERLCTICFTRPGLSRPGVLFLVTNLSVIILKGWPHGFFLISPIRSFQQRIRLFFMPRVRANFAVFHAMSSAASPDEWENFRRAVKNHKGWFRESLIWLFFSLMGSLTMYRPSWLRTVLAKSFSQTISSIESILLVSISSNSQKLDSSESSVELQARLNWTIRWDGSDAP